MGIHKAIAFIISPRLQHAHALGHTTSLYAKLVNLANESMWFIDNSEKFLLQNKEVNDGFIYDQVL